MFLYSFAGNEMPMSEQLESTADNFTLTLYFFFLSINNFYCAHLVN